MMIVMVMMMMIRQRIMHTAFCPSGLCCGDSIGECLDGQQIHTSNVMGKT